MTDKDDPWWSSLFERLKELDEKLDEQNEQLIELRSKVKIMWAIHCFFGVAVFGFIAERILNVSFN